MERLPTIKNFLGSFYLYYEQFFSTYVSLLSDSMSLLQWQWLRGLFDRVDSEKSMDVLNESLE